MDSHHSLHLCVIIHVHSWRFRVLETRQNIKYGIAFKRKMVRENAKLYVMCMHCGTYMYSNLQLPEVYGVYTCLADEYYSCTCTYMDGCAHNAPPCMRTTRKNEMVGWTHWTDTGLIWWDSTTVLPVLHGTIGQDGQGFFRAVVAVLHGTMGTYTIGYYSTYAMGRDRHRIDQ